MSNSRISVILLACLSLVSNAQSDADELPVITLQKWQYCSGCKATVEILANLATREIVKMQEKGLPVGEELDISPLMDEVCSHHFLSAYQPFVEHSCHKLMSEHRNDFVDVFDGTDASSAFSTVKGNIHAKTKEVCVTAPVFVMLDSIIQICLTRARACSSYVFPNTDLPKVER